VREGIVPRDRSAHRVAHHREPLHAQTPRSPGPAALRSWPYRPASRAGPGSQAMPRQVEADHAVALAQCRDPAVPGRGGIRKSRAPAPPPVRRPAPCPDSARARHPASASSATPGLHSVVAASTRNLAPVQCHQRDQAQGENAADEQSNDLQGSHHPFPPETAG
jgi:hypothetical protein